MVLILIQIEKYGSAITFVKFKKYYATQKAVDDISFEIQKEAFLDYLDPTVQVKQPYSE